MRIQSLSVKEAQKYLQKQSRHYKTDAEIICAIGVGEEELHGAAILGRRDSEDGELVHIYCDGTSQAYSLLYGACWRALKALGYVKAVL